MKDNTIKPIEDEYDRRYRTFKALLIELTDALNEPSVLYQVKDLEIKQLFLQAFIAKQLSHISWSLNQLIEK